MTRKIIFTLAICSLLMGCTTTAIISDLSTDRVLVQATGGDMAVIEQEARRGCAIHDRIPVSVSVRCLDYGCINSEHLYACQPQD